VQNTQAVLPTEDGKAQGRTVKGDGFCRWASKPIGRLAATRHVLPGCERPQVHHEGRTLPRREVWGAPLNLIFPNHASFLYGRVFFSLLARRISQRNLFLFRCNLPERQFSLGHRGLPPCK